MFPTFGRTVMPGTLVEALAHGTRISVIGLNYSQDEFGARVPLFEAGA